MAKVLIEPISKMATPGNNTSFKVRVEGDDASTIHVVPCKEAQGYRVELAGGTSEAPVGKGARTLTIEVPAKASMA